LLKKSLLRINSKAKPAINRKNQWHRICKYIVAEGGNSIVKLFIYYRTRRFSSDAECLSFENHIESCHGRIKESASSLYCNRRKIVGVAITEPLRDVIGLEIGGGTAQVNQMVIARELIGKEFRPY
jgi:hypothetical protein